MEFEKGNVVKSTAGRDKGKLLLVAQVSKDRILLCDGRERPLLRPKQKNPRHIVLTGQSLSAEKVETNRALKRALRQLQVECSGKTIGG